MTLPYPSPDLRQEERRILRVRAIVDVTTSSLAYDVRTENVSASGLAVRMPLPLAANTKIRATFILFAGNKPNRITLAGAVVYTLLSGDSWLTGLAISSISDDHRRTLSNYSAGRL